MAGHRKQKASKQRRRGAWAPIVAVPAGILTVAAAFTTGSADVDSPEASSAQLIAETVTAQPPAAEAPTAEAQPLDAELAAVQAQPVAEPAPQPEPPTRPAGLPTEVREGGVPDINYLAYRNAETLLASQRPQCGISWTLIAGIGRVESTHANNGAADADGNLLTPILGPLLDGSLRGNAVIRDTDGGQLDGNASFDRAVGATQFLPETWNAFAGDGNGDGQADPQNLYDAALTTGNYLCHGTLDLRNPVDIARAVLRYNHSQAYVNDVVGYAEQYAAH